MIIKQKKYKSFHEFYPFYLSEHMNPICRLLHFIGTIFVILTISVSIFIDTRFLFATPLVGYGFAWIGHFLFEKNRPATFTYPFYSFLGDWVMLKDIILKKESIFNPKIQDIK